MACNLKKGLTAMQITSYAADRRNGKLNALQDTIFSYSEDGFELMGPSNDVWLSADQWRTQGDQ